MIKGVVIHMTNEQPMLADLYAMPAPSDMTLVCTNLRMKGGQRPVSVDAMDSVFVFPLVNMRFIEIPAGASGALVPLSGPGAGVGVGSADAMAPGAPGSEPAVEPGGPDAAPPEPEPELEIDEDFLRRVREI